MYFEEIYVFSCVTAPRLFNLSLYCDRSGNYSLLWFIIPFTSSYSSYLFLFNLSSNLTVFSDGSCCHFTNSLQRKLFVKLWLIYRMWGQNALGLTFGITILIQILLCTCLQLTTSYLFIFLSCTQADENLKQRRKVKWSGTIIWKPNQEGTESELRAETQSWVCQNSTKLNPTIYSESFTF